MLPIHEQAKDIFQSIRDIPYRLPEFLNDEAPQCAYKSQRLISELGAIGYKTRYRVAEMDWSESLFPKHITALHPSHIVPTHMYLEVMENGEWRPLDASWDIGLSEAGFPIAQFDGTNSPGLRLTKLYTIEEAEDYLKLWSDQRKVEEYFLSAGLFLKAANAWLSDIRTS